MSNLIEHPLIDTDNENFAFPNLSQLITSSAWQYCDGTQGANRELNKSCQIRAHNDFEAVQCWLQEYKANKNTYDSYQKEADRLLLWCIYQRKKSLSSLDREDLEEYFKFLANPQPADFWCGATGGRGRVRGSPDWRPFKNGLKQQSSIVHSTAIIDSLIKYLVTANYLAFNPLDLKRKRINQQVAMATKALQADEKVLQPDEWEAFLVTIEEMPETMPHERDEKERTRFIIYSLYFLLLRVHELEKHPWNSFVCIHDLWFFCVIGKGSKPALIPVKNTLLESIQRYRLYL